MFSLIANFIKMQHNNTYNEYTIHFCDYSFIISSYIHIAKIIIHFLLSLNQRFYW